nr:response regulator transcription factor [Ardenticatena sp.]
MYKILLVSSNREPVEPILATLEQEAFRVLLASSADEAVEVFNRDFLDAVLIVRNGLTSEACHQLCDLVRTHSRLPVLVLVERDEEATVVDLLHAGADDVVEQTRTMEVVVRLKKWLVRLSMPQPRVVQLPESNVEIDLTRRVVLRDGRRLQLSPTEERLLFYLAENVNTPLSHDQLLEHVWGHRDAQRQNLKLYILYLRRKLEPNPDQPRYLRNIRRVGYALIGDLAEEASEERDEQATEPQTS